MNICVAVNNKYLKPLSVMLYSLALNNPIPLKVFILHLRISKKIQKDFSQKIEKWNMPIHIEFITINKNIIRENISYGRYGMEAVLRLALLKVLPLSIDKVLWLDTDIIVKADIQKLYNYPDHGQCAVVCEDMLPKWEKYELVYQIGMKMADRYFNSGVMLLYLENIRKQFDESAFLRWMHENPDKLKYPDQNTLNVCLNGKLCWEKPEIYNLQLLRAKHGRYWSKIIYKSKILHYNTREKPWDDTYAGEGEMEFWKYGIRILGISECFHHYIRKVSDSGRSRIRLTK